MLQLRKLTWCVALSSVGCVHAQVERTGRLPFAEGEEGLAPVIDTLPDGSNVVARLEISSDGLATADRLSRHLQRRASLLGCDAVTEVRVTDHSVQGTCVRHHETASAGMDSVPRLPSQELLARVRDAGDDGATLGRVLAQMQQRPVGERAWPLHWYLQTYPHSPFADDLRALFAPADPPDVSSSAASVRMAPLP